MRKLLYSALFLTTLAFVFSSCSTTDDTTPDNSTATVITDGTDAILSKPSKTYVDKGEGTGTVTWESGNVYVLDGLVFVNSGQTLTIQAGTVIKGKKSPTTGANTSALIVARGGKIIAEGTAAAPIIFTAEADDLAGTMGTKQGEWGGLIVLGKAGLNSSPGETAIEGIPTTEERGIYGGGTDDADNSGIIKYVSIRHGGALLGADNEINGLTLGGVGTGTTISYVEIFANLDDGVEFFGGTVSADHLVISYCGDESIDWDEGYRGTNNQFYFCYQGDTGDYGGEHDGGTDPETNPPFATPAFYNVTFIGNGSSTALRMRDNTGGKYINSIFYNFGLGFEMERLTGTSTYDRYIANDLEFLNNTVGKIGGTTALNDKLFVIAPGSGVSAADSAAFYNTMVTDFPVDGNTIDDNVLASTATFVPAMNNATITTGAPTAAMYRGAFDASVTSAATSWFGGWTALAAQSATLIK